MCFLNWWMTFVTVWRLYTLWVDIPCIVAPHTWHTLLNVINKCSSLLALDSGHLDSNLSLQWDNGRLTFSHALNNTLTNHTQTLQLKTKRRILKQWQRGKCRSVRSCGFDMANDWHLFSTDSWEKLLPYLSPQDLGYLCTVLYLPARVTHLCSSVCGQAI